MNAVEVQGLRKSYGSIHAVAGIELTIATGEIFALLGPNGAGKTTAVEILGGYRARDSGDVRVLGFDPAGRGQDARQWRNRIGIVLQATSDSGDLTVIETIEHFTGYYSNPRNSAEVINAVGLDEKAGSLIRKLSGGQRRRLDVALGIVGNPELLFLDEPTTGFDPQARRSFWELIEQLRRDGTTILLTTHYLDEAEALADRVGVINHGRMIETAAPTELGGRKEAESIISWRAGGQVRTATTNNPTAFIKNLSLEFVGEIPELTVVRPSLEDIYLKMIGALDE